MKKALIAMSGGVDSSVAAYVMRTSGYQCTGCTMRLFENDMIGEDLFSTCCSAKDTEDARAVSERIGMPYHIFHYENEFREKVIEAFVESYERGETPNPCIECNRHLKFDILYEKAKELDCDTIVTGHYARIEEEDGRLVLKKAKDTAKDQSYVLYQLSEEQLRHTAFPLGDMTKDEVRKIAAENGFVNAEKKESQDICFVPDKDYGAFLKRYREKNYPPGPIVNEEGERLGTHEGIVNYTIGQRRGLKVASDRRLYVKQVDVTNNTVVLSEDEALYSDRMRVREVCFVNGVPGETFESAVKIRYRHTEAPARVTMTGADTAEVVFSEPQRAVTPGQAAVFYEGEKVLGGGVISG